ncbi:MAG: hypothetical protein ACT6QU_00130 [Aliihoeflea sp.]|jgi:hypothetical protein|uniref:hypothetical protein n=1 Tax=Aliihoeflea sp. TaxID=2608088 RepID=UPI0040346C29
MLARRFSIVCMMMMFFGMGLSILVAEASRPARVLDLKAPTNCLFDRAPSCGDVQSR